MGAWLLVTAAVVLDRMVGDPRWCPHPVEAMGWAIRQLQHLAESWAGDRPGRLRLAGGVITLLVVGGSGGAGWLMERLAGTHRLAVPLLVIALASALAGRSLEQAVRAVLTALPAEPEAAGAGSLAAARQRLAWIVGRDVARLDRQGLLRAAAETASENAVDGLFAPLFWMLLGALLWDLAPAGAATGCRGPSAWPGASRPPARSIRCWATAGPAALARHRRRPPRRPAHLGAVPPGGPQPAAGGRPPTAESVAVPEGPAGRGPGSLAERGRVPGGLCDSQRHEAGGAQSLRRRGTRQTDPEPAGAARRCRRGGTDPGAQPQAHGAVASRALVLELGCVAVLRGGAP